MSEDYSFEAAGKVVLNLARLFQKAIDRNIAGLKIKMDPEIEQEIRERIAVLMFNDKANDQPVVSYLAVWEEGDDEIAHAYLSPKIETLCEFTPSELMQIGYNTIVMGNIISFYDEINGMEEQVNPVSEVRKKRVAGFLENRTWEGCYLIETKSERLVWVIDKSSITRYRNNIKGNIICLSGGILLESTGLLSKLERNSAGD